MSTASSPIILIPPNLECGDSLPDFETAYEFHRYILKHRSLVAVRIGPTKWQATEQHTQWMVKGNWNVFAAGFRTVEAISCAARMAHHMDGTCCGMHKELLECEVVGNDTPERQTSPM
ncbi:Protein of unknown function [Pyronema omphalodes CBS 100304]|uniref:Uncharacterized protein n=1 Tax=Pyronema omphalodes (strain CBS 100304) TaxID=1076935 RepID=U4LGG5_PYROM|nr:Protein of unknown function [Pyronema omphalodes CBS 100304]